MGERPKFNSAPPGGARQKRRIRAGSELNHAAALLIQFNGFEQRLKIAFAEALIALALNDFEEDGADGVLGEYLQQDAAVDDCRRSGCRGASAQRTDSRWPATRASTPS